MTTPGLVNFRTVLRDHYSRALWFAKFSWRIQMNKRALILVVDDNPACRELLVGILELHGFRMIAATCGREAVELAITFQPGLVLMDLSMPGMNGFEATQAIHAH